MTLNMGWEPETGKRKWRKTNEIQVKYQFKVGKKQHSSLVPSYDKCSKAIQHIHSNATVVG